jgi:hypothetical protein
MFSSSAAPRRKWPLQPSLKDVKLNLINQDGSKMRFRQAFAYQDFSDDDHADGVLAMDEQEQEELIVKLRREDLMRNQFYCVCLPPTLVSDLFTPQNH